MKRLTPVVATAVALIVAALGTPAAAQSPITVVSPHDGERVGVSPYYVRWSASAIAGNALFIAHYIDGAGEVREICSAPSTARECLWNEPDWFATTLSIDARNSSGATLATAQSGVFVIEAEGLPGRFYTHLDIGKVGRSGGAWGRGADAADVRGAGGDIWGTADAFRYHYGTMDLSGVVSARVTSLQPTDPWAKAGVMIRQDISAGSPHVMLIASPGKGIAMQYRALPGGPSANVAIVPGAAPVWLRLTRRGGSVLGEASNDGVSWREIGRIDIALGQYVTAGLAVTSHVTNRLAKAEFEDLVLQP